MSRLDDIRAQIEGGGCDQCESARLLLAVVDAMRNGESANTVAEATRRTAMLASGQTRAELLRIAAAWKALT